MQNEIAGTVSMSILGMFNHSDIFMKTLIIALLAASVWSWAIIIEKWRTFKKIRQRSATFERQFWSGGSLENLYNDLNGKAKYYSIYGKTYLEC